MFDEYGYLNNYNSNKIEHIIEVVDSVSNETKNLSQIGFKHMFKNFLIDVKIIFSAFRAFAEFIIIIGTGIGIYILVAVSAYRSQQRTQAEKERTAVAQEYKLLSKDGVKPWQDIINRKVERPQQLYVLNDDVKQKISSWQLDVPISDYDYNEYTMRMKHIVSALNFMENNMNGHDTKAMRKIRILNAHGAFIQKIINEYKSYGRPFNKAVVKMENGNIWFKRTVNVNAQTLQFEIEDFRKQIMEFICTWL